MGAYLGHAERRKLRFKSPHRRPGGNPAALQSVDHGLDVVIIQVGFVEGDGVHGLAYVVRRVWRLE